MTHSTLPTSGVVLFRLNAEMSCAASRMRNAPMKLNCMVPRQRNQRRNGEHEKRKDERDEHAPQRILCIGRERAVFGRVREGAEGDLHVCGKGQEQNDRADHTAKDHDAAPKAVHRGKNTLL